MGLDQYWETVERSEFAYHRKFNALQGFMEDQFRKQGQDGDFNCRDVVITTKLLDELEVACQKGELKPKSGFFFGSTDIDDYYRMQVKELLDDVIPKARELLAEGKVVMYHSWW